MMRYSFLIPSLSTRLIINDTLACSCYLKHQSLIQVFKIKYIFVSISLLTPQVIFSAIDRQGVFITIISFSLLSFCRKYKRKNIKHDTICGVDFDQEAIEHDTIKASIVYTREPSSDKIAFISFSFLIFFI